LFIGATKPASAKFNKKIMTVNPSLKAKGFKELAPKGGETIRVDTLHKVVIIAIGGKIGNPLLSVQATSRNRSSQELTTKLQLCRNGGLSKSRHDPGMGERQIMDDFGSGASYGEAPTGPHSYPLHPIFSHRGDGRAEGASKGWMKV
jgi:hypothetical protein